MGLKKLVKRYKVYEAKTLSDRAAKKKKLKVYSKLKSKTVKEIKPKIKFSKVKFTRALGNNPGSNNKHLLETYSSLLLSERHHLNNRSDLTFQQLFNSLQWHEGAVKDNIEKAKNKFLLSGKRFLWQYRVPKIVKSNLLMTLTGHNARVRSCSFSPDGKKIISGSDNTRHSTDLQAISSNNFDDHTLILWDSKTGQEIYSMKGVRGVKKCGFSDDGKNILLLFNTAMSMRQLLVANS
jgi:WD40 repeat protein